MAKPLKDFKEIEDRLSGVFGSFTAQIEGYLFSARIEHHKMTLRVVVYVNNAIKGIDLHNVDSIDDLTDVARFFYHKRTKRLLSKVKADKLEKKFGKKYCKTYDLHKTFICVSPIYPSPKALVSELKKHFQANQIVELLPHEYKDLSKEAANV